MFPLRLGSVILPILKIPPENIIPVGLLAVFGALSLRSPVWTMVSFILLVVSLHVIYKRIRKKCSSFYFSFTLCSLIGAHMVYELVASNIMRITYFEYIINIFLFTLTLYLIYRTKIAIGNESSELLLGGHNLDNDPMVVERRRLALAAQQIPYYNYCRRCQTTIPGRDHHCVWLNVCIGKDNRYYFLGCIAIACCWICMISNIYLNSICHSLSVFSESEGPLTSAHHYGLVPVTCPDVYVKTLVTIGFVTSLYGLVVLLFLLAVLFHQLRLLYKGVSYLELKYSGVKKPSKSSSVSS